MSFEAIGLNLVNQPDFDELSVVGDDIKMRAERVSKHEDSLQIT